MAHGSPIPEQVPTPTGGGGGGGGGRDYQAASDSLLIFWEKGGDAAAGSELDRRGVGGGGGGDGGNGGTTGSTAAARTQFESERQLDLANAKDALASAEERLKSAATAQKNARTEAARQAATAAFQSAQIAADKARLDFDRAQAKIENVLNRDTLNASIAATKQRLEEIELEARLAFESQDKLLTKRLEAEKEMLTLRLDNDFRELLFSEIGAERRTLIQEQGETRRLAAELQGKDPFRQATLLGGQAQRGRTPAQLFGQQNQAFLNQPLPQANVSAPFPTGGAGTGDPAIRAQALAALQAQLTGSQNRPLQPQAPVGLARGGIIEMNKSNGTFSMQKPVSFLVGEGAGVIPGITEVLTIGDGKVTVSPLMGGFQFGGTVLQGPGIVSPRDLPPPDPDAPPRPPIPRPGLPPDLRGDSEGETPAVTTSQLIRIDGGKSVYYWDGKTYRHLVSASVFSGSGFSMSDVADISSSDAEQFNFGAPITSAFNPATGAPTPEQLVRFGGGTGVYWWDADSGQYRWISNIDAFTGSGFSMDDVFDLSLTSRALLTFGDDITDPFGTAGPPADTLPPVREVPPPEPPVVTPPPEGPVGPSQQDILAGLQALAPGFAGLTEFVPRTQTGQFGGVNALRDFFSLQGQNFVQDPFSGQFRPFLPGLPEGVNPTAIPGAPTSFGAPVVNPGAFNLQNLATLGFDPALVRLGGQDDIFYRDPTTGELRQFGTPDIFEQSGFNLADVFNISPTGQNFQFGSAITSPLPLQPNANTSGPFRQPLIDPFTGALLFDPFQNASSLLQLQQSNPSAFLNLLSSFGTAGLDPIGFQSRLDLATPTGALDNPQRIGFTGTRL